MPFESAIKTNRRALLVGIHLSGTSALEFNRSLGELSRLVDTLGLEIAGTLTQKMKATNAASMVGPGKLLEIASWTEGTGVVEIETHKTDSKAKIKRDLETFQSLESDEDLTGNQNGDDDEDDFDQDGSLEDDDEADSDDQDDVGGASTNSKKKKPKKVGFVVFDCELTPTQHRNLERALGCDVMDRTGIIVEIFHRHAQSPAAKAQVEIARLTYLTPRLRATGGGERQGGGIGAKGAGETKHELDKRRIRDRIAELKANLEVIHQESALRRSRRKSAMKVALVGYTNAGKSSLMRALTGSDVLIADKLFATLDTTVRSIYPETKPKILATDTVGFIQKLPHELVASFRTTLDEALDASLLLYVVDAADPSMKEQLETTREVLTEIEAHDIPHFIVLNKEDKLSNEQKNLLIKDFPKGIFLSTRSPESVSKLRDQIVSFFETSMIEKVVSIPYSKGQAVAEFHQTMRIVSETHSETGTELRVKGFEQDLDRILKTHALKAKNP
ncbi:MAG: GTPase HflX [Proteobacteria bacterium]|nr:GTPase HflX [Pseudomonadota bacterium]